MKVNRVKWFGYLFSFSYLIISCAGTEITPKQVDEVYKGKPVSDILIIAVTSNEHNRRSFEKKFVAYLKSVDIDAISSEEAILNAVNQYENDAVISDLQKNKLIAPK